MKRIIGLSCACVAQHKTARNFVKARERLPQSTLIFFNPKWKVGNQDLMSIKSRIRGLDGPTTYQFIISCNIATLAS